MVDENACLDDLCWEMAERERERSEEEERCRVDLLDGLGPLQPEPAWAGNDLAALEHKHVSDSKLAVRKYWPDAGWRLGEGDLLLQADTPKDGDLFEQG